ERECSIQRRHQKVLEESPSPVVTRDLRAALGEAAVAVARRAGYVNAGTVEFIVGETGEFYFLEMNTRLQVEHPVTEMVTGLDLVHLQIAIAAGEPLPFGQEQVAQRGHAIEARIYAEDAARGFLPAVGRLTAFAPPTGPGIRNDVGVFAGDEVTVYYDPMLAKLIVHGSDRRAAIDRLRTALAEYRVEGVTTNLPFLRWLADHPAFRAGETTTDFIDRHFSPELLAAQVPEDVVIGAVAMDLLSWEWAHPAGASAPDRAPAADPWRAAGPWRQLRAAIRLAYEIDGQPARATAAHLAGGFWQITVGEQPDPIEVEITLGTGGRAVVRAGDRALTFEVAGDEPRRLTWQGRVYTVGRPRPLTPEELAQGAPGSAAHGSLKAPMPGTIVRILVEEGDRVEALQSLIILEAMKMEHVIQAPYAGIVRRIHYRAGELVPGDADLVELDSA
ncbi:MAG TPA: biotin/lipoyl-containing protein, partial [Dehalococcoidia bacterium]|nr:biotin/lipoyl-containing protein [Dehalococcoidia bacterium]